MKKTYLSLIALFASFQISYAQWTTGTNINNTNAGNVGIGTSTPAGKLHVNTSNYDFLMATASVDIGMGGTIYPWARSFRVVSSSNSNGLDGAAFGVIGNGATPNYAYIAIPTSDPIGYDSYKIISLNNSGNVGIGTIDPKGYKLAVNGSAIATSMKVKLNNWPDFVFLKDYKLPTLTEVKTYIDKNQHLPDMPSADEVHTNGLDLGEMNRLLLKKVEELTLYIIEKDEQLAAQHQRVEKVNKEILCQQKVNQTLQEQIYAIKKRLNTIPKTVNN